METSQENATSPMSRITDDSQCTSMRRSSRTKKVPAKYDEEYIIPNAKAPGRPAIKQDRPKRKAAQAATQNIVPEDAGPILEDVLSHMSPDERKEYDGWVELESDPGFFGAMLRELGVTECMIQEIYSLGPETWKELPQPVHGLIFLFEYEGDDESSNTENRPDCPDYLWFANQTTANACATVALMNIIMNASDVLLGPELNSFRSRTYLRPPPIRGHMLDREDFIRGIHNSLARRIDLIAEDLALDNKYEDSQKKRKAHKKATKPKRKKPNADTSYHYIAYVPKGDQVWELDGLQTKPLSRPIPQSAEGSWLDAAGEAIQERMMRNSEFSSYNLLAICRSPLKERTHKLGQSLFNSRQLYKHERGFGIPDPFEAFPDDRLHRLGFNRHSIDNNFWTDMSLKATMDEPGFDNAQALALAKKFESERDELEVLIVAEQESINEMMERYRSRQRDFTPAIHHWVRTLAEKGVLRELIQEIDRES